MIDINELRRLAQAATHLTTKGRWMRLSGERTVCDRLEAGCRGLPVVSTPVHPPNPFEAACLDFIAAANPAAISELLDRLEAAEKELAELRSSMKFRTSLLGRTEAERDALRVELNEIQYGVAVAHDTIKALRDKITEMEQQEPVAWARKLGLDVPSFGCVTDLKYRPSNIPESSYIPLYTLPGAQTQPAPRVPTALLVAVANLVAQMEIVSRVGFVDTPNDKDSCAAFCVAEGTWLELMSAVESLASALAAAPDAKR